ncbi:hypothetical protein SARC_03261 [Sphaeroforma arctica JP610]|uniref:RNA helicase n=1 Tax=Sphaeroforma arctica JP610 TaxID=667725 RepID=A0A0L0G658_9EUKA|nr:hypothetical protein SARC_03261 [Sphaeroforma arctica JP610]KNC84515.1 hypothetical protein SARC_03261 [Sphaeroforma arctica JP610]|eukprot:XP_014158417.1 hypothetical protein SARC_03261 [Sphaeroforma arctica JP610]
MGGRGRSRTRSHSSSRSLSPAPRSDKHKRASKSSSSRNKSSKSKKSSRSYRSRRSRSRSDSFSPSRSGSESRDRSRSRSASSDRERSRDRGRRHGSRSASGRNKHSHRKSSHKESSRKDRDKERDRDRGKEKYPEKSRLRRDEKPEYSGSSSEDEDEKRSKRRALSQSRESKRQKLGKSARDSRKVDEAPGLNDDKDGTRIKSTVSHADATIQKSAKTEQKNESTVPEMGTENANSVANVADMNVPEETEPQKKLRERKERLEAWRKKAQASGTNATLPVNQIPGSADTDSQIEAKAKEPELAGAKNTPEDKAKLSESESTTKSDANPNTTENTSTTSAQPRKRVRRKWDLKKPDEASSAEKESSAPKTDGFVVPKPVSRVGQADSDGSKSAKVEDGPDIGMSKTGFTMGTRLVTKTTKKLGVGFGLNKKDEGGWTKGPTLGGLGGFGTNRVLKGVTAKKTGLAGFAMKPSKTAQGKTKPSLMTRSVFGGAANDDEDDDDALKKPAMKSIELLMKGKGDVIEPPAAAATTAKSSGAAPGSVTAAATSAENDEAGDDLDTYMKNVNTEVRNLATNRRRKESIVPDKDAALKPKKKSKRGERVYNDEDAIEYSSEEEEEEVVVAVKQKDIVKVDYSKLPALEFRKAFYVEVPELKKMSEDDVFKRRVEMDNTRVKGKDCPRPVSNWAQCGVSSRIMNVIKKNGYDKPMPIQAQTIPAIMSGRDVIGIARTGSGKTIAFLVPMFRHILDQPEIEQGDGPIAMIMAPTRELAIQIYTECRKFAKVSGVRAVCVYGGSGISEQIADLKRGAEIIVCTPGRMIDMLCANSGRVTNLRRVTYLVLDEADRMFDMGFEPQVMKVVDNTRKNRQTVLFSATFPRQMEALARKILNKNPIEINVGGRSVVSFDIDQNVVVLSEDEKFLKLLELLGYYLSKGLVLIFVEKQEKADMLLKDLLSANYPCQALHGGMHQEDRGSVLDDFKRGVCNLLIATSVAARGLDVKALNLVVNYGMLSVSQL